MPKFDVKWKEARIINIYAYVEADTAEEAIKKAQGYNIDDSKGEYLEENESHTDQIFQGKAVKEE